jgi:hypothetical protein
MHTRGCQPGFAYSYGKPRGHGAASEQTRIITVALPELQGLPHDDDF